jgi:hypothetical protein
LNKVELERSFEGRRIPLVLSCFGQPSRIEAIEANLASLRTHDVALQSIATGPVENKSPQVRVFRFRLMPARMPDRFLNS